MRKRKMYLSVEDIAELFELSVSFAYRVVERMNADLASKNYYVILGGSVAACLNIVFKHCWECTEHQELLSSKHMYIARY